MFEAHIRFCHNHDLDIVFVFDPNEFLAFAVVQIIANSIMYFNCDPCDLVMCG